MANIKNLANGIVLTPPSGTSGTTLVLESGYGAIMPATPFFLTCTPSGQLSTMGNSEIVQVTARSTDTLTIVRAQKGTTARTMSAGWVVGNGVYAEDILAGTSSFVPQEVPSGLVNSSNKVYTASQAYMPGTLEVYVNGLRQKGTTHFVETTPASGIFTMDEAPITGDIIDIRYQTAVTGAGNADTVDNYHANATPTANTLLPLDSNAKIPAAAIPTNTAWITPTYNSGWGDYGAGWGGARYIKMPDGTVRFKGLIKNVSGGTSSTGATMFTLPAGYRPLETLRFVVNTSAGTVQLDINITGTVVLNVALPNTEWASISTVNFIAEA